MEAAYEAFQTWKRTSAEERANLLFRVAGILRERKHELSAWMIYEVGKTWPEADGDTAEAIDFCEFYAREMLRYAEPPPLTNNPGKKSLEYIPLGGRCRDPALDFARDHGRDDLRFFLTEYVVLKPSSDAPTSLHVLKYSRRLDFLRSNHS